MDSIWKKASRIPFTGVKDSKGLAAFVEKTPGCGSQNWPNGINGRTIIIRQDLFKLCIFSEAVDQCFSLGDTIPRSN
jgi:hypothetical protein